MRFEFSAGGIVYKRKRGQDKILKQSMKQACLEQCRRVQDRVQDDIEILVSQHSQHHGWVFPKGLINERSKIKNQRSKIIGETKEQAALREVREETGVVGKIVKELPPATYWYVLEGEKIKKTVYYFLMEYIEGDITKHDHEMEDVKWLPIEKVEERLTYKSDKKMWKQAKKIKGQLYQELIVLLKKHRKLMIS